MGVACTDETRRSPEEKLEPGLMSAQTATATSSHLSFDSSSSMHGRVGTVLNDQLKLGARC